MKIHKLKPIYTHIQIIIKVEKKFSNLKIKVSQKKKLQRKHTETISNLNDKIHRWT